MALGSSTVVRLRARSSHLWTEALLHYAYGVMACWGIGQFQSEFPRTPTNIAAATLTRNIRGTKKNRSHASKRLFGVSRTGVTRLNDLPERAWTGVMRLNDCPFTLLFLWEMSLTLLRPQSMMRCPCFRKHRSRLTWHTMCK